LGYLESRRLPIAGIVSCPKTTWERAARQSRRSCPLPREKRLWAVGAIEPVCSQQVAPIRPAQRRVSRHHGLGVLVAERPGSVRQGGGRTRINSIRARHVGRRFRDSTLTFTSFAAGVGRTERSDARRHSRVHFGGPHCVRSALPDSRTSASDCSPSAIPIHPAPSARIAALPLGSADPFPEHRQWRDDLAARHR
jgi:hypothetical protein